jgi:hypothetical protein
MNEWVIPVSKDKIIARRNRLIEYQKVEELRFTPLYEAIDENILDINYMLHEIDNLQSKIDKAIEFVESMEYCGQEDYFYDNKSKDPCGNDNTFNDSKNKLLDILKEDK